MFEFSVAEGCPVFRTFSFFSFSEHRIVSSLFSHTFLAQARTPALVLVAAHLFRACARKIVLFLGGLPSPLRSLLSNRLSKPSIRGPPQR